MIDETTERILRQGMWNINTLRNSFTRGYDVQDEPVTNSVSRRLDQQDLLIDLLLKRIERLEKELCVNLYDDAKKKKENPWQW